ncbi:MAG: ABC transporter ATP-binding protein [Pseudolabrys sp.]|nr:ABC transporter ATP-binding protein [Pseudolabrys sp.]MDP2296223.1 ABC transporter ATP-binding protein [Pseudolabrys sp.]
MLKVEDVVCRYGRIEVLHGVSLKVGAGEIVSLIGSNGAGKTTLMRVISGILPMTGGRIVFEDEEIDRLPAHLRVVRGIAQVPEARQVFAPLSVDDNLLLGGFRRNAADVPRELDRIYALFPALADRRGIAAGNLSGGQQQMLAIGRALMSGPRLLLLDEPSMGLAPVLVDQILDTVVALRKDGVTILLVEQNVNAALAIADRAYVIETGRIVLAGASATLADNPRVREAYLGL